MDYFILSKNEKIEGFLEKKDFKPIEEVNLLSSDIDPIMLMINNANHNEYVDLIHWREYVVSDRLKKILDKYEEDAFFRPLVCQDVKKVRQDIYWIAVFEEVDCLAKEAEFHKDGGVKKLVLDKTKIEGHRIFTVKGVLERYLIISLDLAESILRRDFLGLKIELIKE